MLNLSQLVVVVGAGPTAANPCPGSTEPGVCQDQWCRRDDNQSAPESSHLAIATRISASSSIPRTCHAKITTRPVPCDAAGSSPAGRSSRPWCRRGLSFSGI